MPNLQQDYFIEKNPQWGLGGQELSQLYGSNSYWDCIKDFH